MDTKEQSSHPSERGYYTQLKLAVFTKKEWGKLGKIKIKLSHLLKQP